MTRQDELKQALEPLTNEQLHKVAATAGVCYYTVVDMSMGALLLKGGQLERAYILIMDALNRENLLNKNGD